METSIFHLRLRQLLLKESKIMAKTLAQKEKHKRYLRKHPEYAIFRLRKWIGAEKDPAKLAKAKGLLKQWLENKKHKKQ